MWSPTCSNNTTTMCQKAAVLWIWGYLLWTTNIFKTIDFKSIPYRTSSQWHSSVFSPSIHSKNVSEENTDYQANSAFKTHSHFGFIFHVRCLSIETSQKCPEKLELSPKVSMYSLKFLEAWANVCFWSHVPCSFSWLSYLRNTSFQNLV